MPLSVRAETTGAWSPTLSGSAEALEKRIIEEKRRAVVNFMSWQSTQVALVGKWTPLTAVGGSNIIHFRRVLRGELVERVALGFFDQISTDFAPDLLEASATPALEVAAEMKALTFDRQ